MNQSFPLPLHRCRENKNEYQRECSLGSPGMIGFIESPAIFRVLLQHNGWIVLLKIFSSLRQIEAYLLACFKKVLENSVI